MTERHEQLKRELEEGSQDPGVKLVASQVAEYKKLKNDAEKKSASLKQRLDRVSAVEVYLCKIKNMGVWNLVYSSFVFFSVGLASERDTLKSVQMNYHEICV